jgi:hypothetical protein
MRTFILALLLLGAGVASAQQFTIGGGVSTGTRAVGGGITVGTPGTGVAVPVSPAIPPLTPAAALAIRQRLEAYSTYQAQVAPRPSALREAGLSADNDAVAQTTTTPMGAVGPAHVGRLLPRAPGNKDAVDPALADVSRLATRARLGREPTAAEVSAELSAFDARIAQLNQSLATMRPDIVKSMKSTGVFPRALEAGVLGVAPADPQRGSTQAREGVRALYQDLLSR